MNRSILKRLWYDFFRAVSCLVGVVVFRMRVRNANAVPREGGALILSNHQSNFDPVIVGVACHRRLNFLARKSLFATAGFRHLIESLEAIPIDRDGSGLGGLKETLRRLKRGEAVLIFPEGTRTVDGTVAPLKPGFCALARRAGVPLVPLAIEGAFAAWPRWRKFPRRSTIAVQFGAPLEPTEIAALDDQQLLAAMELRIRSCHAGACALAKTSGVLAGRDRGSS